ncbi:hypothetical protein [Shewanella sp. NIFS-20-20]|uniref:hypothetical protein n=1 Tax=Shewanella sp. NIFS-20-20 TaxID=2853806 RepID=UPI001C45B2A7|nr:hypothetical protein [Shewanella sp. NIFS-20-20]MBV7314814.1 hypothetical protein [Shewanella sp. NIFS-20-20]
MANAHRSLILWSVIGLQLFALLVLLAFGWQQWQLSQQLAQEVQQLKASQTLIVVGDEQAQDFADWLTANPQQLDELLASSQQLPAEARRDANHSLLAGDSARIHPLTEQAMLAGEQQDTVGANDPRAAQLLAADTPELTQQAQGHTQADITTLKTIEAARDDGAVVARNPLRQPIAASQLPTQPVVMSQDEQGVKVILLPHGGIRVTTRQDN